MGSTSEKQHEVQARALEFLKSRPTMVISSVSENGEPQASTVYYVTDENFNLYFMTSLKSRKCENLHSNSKIAFVVGTGPEVITIQGGGEVEKLDEKETEVFYTLIEKISFKSPWQWPLLLLSKEGFCTFRIKPKWMVWLNLHKEEYPDIAQEKFYKII